MKKQTHLLSKLLLITINLLFITGCDKTHDDSENNNDSKEEILPENLISEELKLTGFLVITSDCSSNDVENMFAQGFFPEVELEGFTSSGEPYSGFTKVRNMKKDVNNNYIGEYNITYKGAVFDKEGTNEAKLKVFSDLVLCVTPHITNNVSVGATFLKDPVKSTLEFEGGSINIGICILNFEDACGDDGSGTCPALDVFQTVRIDLNNIRVRSYMRKADQKVYFTPWENLNDYRIEMSKLNQSLGIRSNDNVAPPLIIDVGSSGFECPNTGTTGDDGSAG